MILTSSMEYLLRRIVVRSWWRAGHRWLGNLHRNGKKSHIYLFIYSFVYVQQIWCVLYIQTIYLYMNERLAKHFEHKTCWLTQGWPVKARKLISNGFLYKYNRWCATYNAKTLRYLTLLTTLIPLLVLYLCRTLLFSVDCPFD